MWGEGRRIVVGKAGRQDAHDRIALSIERNVFADKCGVAAIALLPEPVAHNGRGAASFFFFRNKQSAAQRLNPQNRKQVGGHSLPGDLLRPVVSSQIEGNRFKRCQAGEHMVLPSPVEEVGGGNDVLKPAAMWI